MTVAFSAQELDALARLKRLHQSWRVVRWILLLAGLLLVVLGLHHQLALPSEIEEATALLTDPALKPLVLSRVVDLARHEVWGRLEAVFGGLLIAFVVAMWRGSHMHVLVLRLAKDHLASTNPPDVDAT